MSLSQFMLQYSKTASTCALCEILDGFFRKLEAATKADMISFTPVSLRSVGLFFIGL